jgi:hypothetical protein
MTAPDARVRRRQRDAFRLEPLRSRFELDVHPDVEEGMRKLTDAGVRMATRDERRGRRCANRHGASRAGLSTAWLNRRNDRYPEFFLPPTATGKTLRQLADALLAD